jgi:hypothetical protein
MKSHPRATFCDKLKLAMVGLARPDCSNLARIEKQARRQIDSSPARAFNDAN